MRSNVPEMEGAVVLESLRGDYLRVFFIQPSPVQFIHPATLNARNKDFLKPLPLRVDRPEATVKTDELHNGSLSEARRQRVAVAVFDGV